MEKLESKINWFEKQEEGINEKNFFSLIERSLKRIEEVGVEIGAGKTANVCVLENYPSRCYKIINKKEGLKNRAAREAEFLDELAKKGISVPRPICSVQSEENDYIIMEKIDGYSIEQIINNDMLDFFPDDFNFEKFFKNLKSEINKMHDLDIYHGDLHFGNIMIRIVSGEAIPVLIDFGSSIRGFETDKPYQYIDAQGKIVILPNDDYKFGQVYRALGEFLKSRGFFNKSKRKE